MFTVYIAKATANYGLPATRSIYERALEGDLMIAWLAIALTAMYSSSRQTNCRDVSAIRGPGTETGRN